MERFALHYGGSIAFARRERQEAFGNVTPTCDRFSDISASVTFFRELERLFMLCSRRHETHGEERIFMERTPQYDFSGPVTIFHDRRLPEQAAPVGYAALIDALQLRIPLPRTLSAIGPRHKQYQQDGWRIYTPRHAPAADLGGHLTFALKYEGLDLGVLKPSSRPPVRGRWKRSSAPRRRAATRGGPGSSMNGCWGPHSTCRARTREPTLSSSIQACNGRLPVRRRRAIASRTICRERRSSAQ